MNHGTAGTRLVANIVQGVDDPGRFGVKLRLAREERGLSQVELGEMTGYSNGWISSVERGVAIPTGTFARRMEVVLGRDLGVTDLLRDLSSLKRGDVGNWGMTPTEMSGYVGLSRTRIYELLKMYTRHSSAIDIALKVEAGELDGDEYRLEAAFDFSLGYVRSMKVDGWQRIEISECARFVLWENAGRPRRGFWGQSDIDEVGKSIRAWLDRRRGVVADELDFAKPEMGEV